MSKHIFLTHHAERQQLAFVNSAIHKAADLRVPGHSMILPGTIPETPISRSNGAGGWNALQTMFCTAAGRTVAL